jgi:hypothetical protein
VGEVDLPAIVREVFPDPSPGAIAAALEDFCRRTLGAGIAGTEFVAASVGSVHGLALRDGRRVVVKAHGARTSVAFLDAMQTVQRRLADRGFPAPVPLVVPVPLGRGVAVAETLLDGGRVADAHDPAVRRAMAAGLARLVDLARPLAGLPGLRESMMAIPPGRLWPAPHDARFDFAATASGAEWIDRIARAVRELLDRPAGELVVGHTDWRAEHLRFEDGRLSAVYDWDSLAVDREPVIVGSAAHAFTANWAADDGPHVPTRAEALAFVGDYEAARGRAFTPAEARVARAALVYAMAYTARCEHSDALTDFGRRAPNAEASGGTPAPAGSARGFLAAHAAALLGAGVRANRPPS